MSFAVRAAWLLSMAAWLVPIVVLQVVRMRRDRPLWAIALDVPFAVALDLVSILASTRLVRLETAILVSRPAWLLGGVAVAVWRWRRQGWRPRWPKALGARDLLASMFASALAVGVYSGISYEYRVWDYDLHFPNVTAMASQKLPFINALSGSDIFHYHFSGDALAATLRTLSFDVVSSMRALHMGHDLMFAAVAGTVTLLSIGLGLRRRLSAVLGALAVLLQGPIPLRGGVGQTFQGYAYFNLADLSYRPHVPVSVLMLVGALGTVAVRARHKGLLTRSTAYVLLAVVSLLAVTDEASLALLGLGLGAAWLVDPSLVARRRLTGLVLLIGLGVLFLDMNLLLYAALAPGTPLQYVTPTKALRVPPIVPTDPALLLSAPGSKMVLFVDHLPLLACALSLVLLAIHLRSRAHAALAVLACTMVAICAELIMRVDFNHTGVESHRFFVAPFTCCVVLCVVSLDRMPRGSVMSLLALLGVAVPAIYSIYWIHELAPGAMTAEKDVATDTTLKLFDVNCRAITGAHFGDVPRPVYVESAEWATVATCRPIFHQGARTGWIMPQHAATEPKVQIQNLDDHMIPHGEEADAICLGDKKANADLVCKRVTKVRSSCRPYGSRYLKCPLTQADRDAVLAP